MKTKSIHKSIIGKLSCVVATIAVLMLLDANAWAKPLVLKFGTIEPPQGWATENIVKPFFEKVERDAGGTIKIEMYTAGSLGRNPTKYLKHVKDGVMDMGWILNAYQPGQFPDDEVVNIPFVSENALESTLAINRMIKKGLLRGYDQTVLLGAFCLNQYGIHSSFPVKKPEDLVGKKMRLAGKMQHSLFEAVGGTPVGMPATKIAESISRGVVSGVIFEWNGMVTFRVLDLTKYHTNVSFGTVVMSLVLNKKVYDSLPEIAKKAFDKHRGDPLVKNWGEKLIINDRRIMEKTATDPKHHIYTPSAVELNKWKTKMKPVVEDWVGKHPRGKLLLETYQTEIKKIRNQ